MTKQEMEQVKELWHNMFRLHSYVEAELNPVGSERPGLLKRADMVLEASYARLKTLLPPEELRYLEQPVMQQRE